MQAYIAMPRSSAEKVDRCKQLDRAFVGLPKHVLYLSLKDTREHAVQTAVEGNRMKLQVATEHTVWYCLELNVSVHDAFEMVQHGWLVRDLSRGGWRFYGKLEFACLQHTWYEATFPPLAVEAWAEKTLTCFPSKINSVCCKCKEAGKVWVAGKYFQHAEYCSRCWNRSYYKQDATEQLSDEFPDGQMTM